jgi:hypothetical protein
MGHYKGEERKESLDFELSKRIFQANKMGKNSVLECNEVHITRQEAGFRETWHDQSIRWTSRSTMSTDKAVPFENSSLDVYADVSNKSPLGTCAISI